MKEMGDPFQGFIYGQVLFPVTIALKYGIKLIFRGENAEAEYGGSPESWDKKLLTMKEFKKIYFSNYSLDFWLNKGFTRKEMNFFIHQQKKILIIKFVILTFTVILEIGLIIVIFTTHRNIQVFNQILEELKALTQNIHQ